MKQFNKNAFKKHTFKKLRIKKSKDRPFIKLQLISLKSSLELVKFSTKHKTTILDHFEDNF